MLHVHFSNRYETLARQLIAKLGGTREDVFASDQVVIPSAAVQRDLTLALADRHGVCANIEFVYLARWLWQQVARVVDGVAAESPFDPAALAWRVYSAFGDSDFVGAHPRLSSYLDMAGTDDVMRYELAVKVASLLEQYVTYRTDWLARWQGAAPHGRPLAAGEREQEQDERWQAALWQRIAAQLSLESEHPIAELVRALERGGAKLACERGLPAIVHVFGLSAMPPLHMQALQALGRWIDVHLYVLNPCREYWFEVVDPKRLSCLAARGRGQAHETGNRLLAAWGMQAQSHIGLLIDTLSDAAQDDAAFQPNPHATLLARLQNAILELRELEPGSIQLPPADRSIEVHVCHSLTRELEAVHDYLLGLFAADPTLQPSHVLVVTPDLEAAAPLIEAVFGTAPPQRRIPFAMTGRARSTVNAPVRALAQLLSLATSRCPASAVLGLLQQPLVARRFDLDEEALQQVHGWMLAAGIHWGLDEGHVASLGLADAGKYSFSDGLDRLFLGYALPSGIAEPFGHLLASGDAEGSSALALGAFWRFVGALQQLREQLAHPRPPQQWVAVLRTAIATFTQPANEDLDDVSELHASIAQLAAAMSNGGLGEAVPIGVVRKALEHLLDDPARGGVPGGSVTFASISSLRNLPYPVICAIGLNDGAFPTVDRPAEFDLMAHQPRRGDRQRRADQRNLFLDLLIAARRCVYLSYTGRSVRDNSTLPPSVLISELLDVLVPAIASDPADSAALEAARARLVVAHPLQPFSPQAFAVDGDPRLRSFDAELAAALRHSLQTPGQPVESTQRIIDEIDAEEGDAVPEPAHRFFTAPLPEPDAQWRDVTAAQLVEFFRNPSRYLLRRRMNIALQRSEDALEDDEPFLPSVPARSALANRLLPVLLDQPEIDLDAARRLAAAGVELPCGAVGEVVLERELQSLCDFARQVREASRAEPLPAHQANIELDIDGQPWRVQAGFADLRPGGLVRWRYDEERATDVLQAWIHHLVLCADAPAGTEPVTRWLCCGEPRRFEARPNARELLADLVRLYARGLREPLPFFPKAAWKYVRDGSVSAAQGAWRVTKDTPHAEGADPAYQLAFRGIADPLAATDFYELARKVFGPVIGLEDAAP